MTPSRLFALVLTCCAAACAKGEASPNPPSSTTAASAASAAPASGPVGPDTLTQAADRGRVLGAASAKTWLLVVSDFQCPWCKLWHDSTFPALKRDYVDAGKVRVAYINFPLGVHANAFPSALAAMCASAQGKFWETHDRIFRTQAVWEKMDKPEAFLDSLAVASGANAAVQHSCTGKRALLDLVRADQARANKAGASTTPTFFVDGARIEGAQPLALFRHVIDSVLKAGLKGP